MDIARLLFRLRNDRRHLDRAIVALEAIRLQRSRGNKPQEIRRKKTSKASGHEGETGTSFDFNGGSQNRIARVIPIALPQR